MWNSFLSTTQFFRINTVNSSQRTKCPDFIYCTICTFLMGTGSNTVCSPCFKNDHRIELQYIIIFLQSFTGNWNGKKNTFVSNWQFWKIIVVWIFVGMRELNKNRFRICKNGLFLSQISDSRDFFKESLKVELIWKLLQGFFVKPWLNYIGLNAFDLRVLAESRKVSLSEDLALEPSVASDWTTKEKQ